MRIEYFQVVLEWLREAVCKDDEIDSALETAAASCFAGSIYAGTPFQAFSRIVCTGDTFPFRMVSSAVAPPRSGCGVFSQARTASFEPPRL